MRSGLYAPHRLSCCSTDTAHSIALYTLLVALCNSRLLIWCLMCVLRVCFCFVFHSGIFETVQFPSNDFKLSTNVNISAKFSGKTGLLKAVAMGSNEVALDLEFVQYGARPGKERSGAYLFLPDSEATSILSSKEKRKVTVVVGPLVSTMSS